MLHVECMRHNHGGSHRDASGRPGEGKGCSAGRQHHAAGLQRQAAAALRGRVFADHHKGRRIQDAPTALRHLYQGARAAGPPGFARHVHRLCAACVRPSAACPLASRGLVPQAPGLPRQFPGLRAACSRHVPGMSPASRGSSAASRGSSPAVPRHVPGMSPACPRPPAAVPRQSPGPQMSRPKCPQLTANVPKCHGQQLHQRSAEGGRDRQAGIGIPRYGTRPMSIKHLLEQRLKALMHRSGAANRPGCDYGPLLCPVVVVSADD